MKMLLAGLACAMIATSAQASDNSFGRAPILPSFPPGRPAGPGEQGCKAPPQPYVNWQGCYLRGADLRGVDLTGGNLSGADLTGAKLKDAILNNVRVSPQTLWKSGKPCTGSEVSTCPKK